MFYSTKLKKFREIKHCFFSRKGGFSKGLYKTLNCGRGSKDNNLISPGALTTLKFSMVKFVLLIVEL